jgi:ubiquinone/menaquinone biosynthesis C-methylase UbiE
LAWLLKQELIHPISQSLQELDMYKAQLAKIYDIIYHFKDYPKDADYLAAVMREHHPSARSLLETACGTGRFLDLLQEQYQVQGLDLSAEMLQEAAKRVPEIPLHQANMADFSLTDRFDVVCCLFRSIAFVKTANSFFAAVKSMASHLNPGGILVIEPFFTPETFWSDTITLNEYKGDSLKIAWMYTSKKVQDHARLDNQYLVGTPRRVDHFSEVHEMGLFSEEDYHQAFTAAGLQLNHDPVGPSGVGLYIGKKG